MNKIILAVFVVLLLCGVVLRIVFALFFPERFADGARRVLFIDERQKLLSGRVAEKLQDVKSDKETDSS